MIETLLIANRGEIARRIQRTCREMGIRALAVYSDADRDLPGVAEADLAVRLGPAPAAESYLDMEKILAVAVGQGADAIHPGYGFLSENADFAELCRERGVLFVGPAPEAIRAMGDKAEAKRRMAAAGVPVLPGYLGEAQDPATLAKEAERVGYPLLIKAVAGGGGRGIRLVERAADLGSALASAQREATSAFKDGRVMLERYLPAPHHVEFQILADTHGTVLHLFERECSVQRRHQKIVEETPSPVLTPRLRGAMADAAVQGARAIGYVGAGTMEFLLDEQGGFYFLEMNTRLQVEHPVTEMTLGLDLVRLQIEVAEGRPLALAQDALLPRGHAIECRLNAENPAQRFLPSVGRIARLAFPAGPGLRVDTGFASGAEVGPHYDSLLAKLIAWGASREEALRRMRRMLERTEVAGLATNLPLLQAICAQPEFLAGRYTTRFIETHEAELLGSPLPGNSGEPALLREQVLALCAVEAWLHLAPALASAPEPARSGGIVRDSGSPWAAPTALHSTAGVVPTLARTLELEGADRDGAEQGVSIRVLPAGKSGVPDAGSAKAPAAFAIEVDWREARHRAHVTLAIDGRLVLDLGDVRLGVTWFARGEERWLTVRGVHLQAACRDPAEHVGVGPEDTAERLQAPLPGKVIKLMIKPGQRVAAGDVLVLLEAMKVEHAITAPAAGRVKALLFKEGDLVQRGDQLVELEEG